MTSHSVYKPGEQPRTTSGNKPNPKHTHTHTNICADTHRHTDMDTYVHTHCTQTQTQTHGKHTATTTKARRAGDERLVTRGHELSFTEHPAPLSLPLPGLSH